MLPRRKRSPPPLDAQLPLRLRILDSLAVQPVWLVGCALLRAANRNISADIILMAWPPLAARRFAETADGGLACLQGIL